MSLEQSFRHVKNCRSVINPNLGFLEQLSTYEHKCRNETEAECTAWNTHTYNGITKRLPEFIIRDFFDEYEHEFEVSIAIVSITIKLIDNKFLLFRINKSVLCIIAESICTT